MRTLCGICALLLALATAQAKRPPEDENMRAAKAHFKQGRAYQDAKAYDEAIAEYQQAFELARLPDLLFNMAQAYRLKGDKTAALDNYKKYLLAAPEGKGADDARGYVATLTTELKAEQAAKPAEHETKPVIPMDGVEIKGAKPGPTGKPAADAPPAPPAEAPSHEGRGMRIAGIATALVGLAAVGGGIFFGLQAKSRADSVSGLKPGTDPWKQSLADEGHAAERNMYICYGIGGAAIVGGAVIYYLGVKAGRPHGVEVAPALAPNTVGLGLHGRF